MRTQGALGKCAAEPREKRTKANRPSVPQAGLSHGSRAKTADAEGGSQHRGLAWSAELTALEGSNNLETSPGRGHAPGSHPSVSVRRKMRALVVPGPGTWWPWGGRNSSLQKGKDAPPCFGLGLELLF